MNFKSKHSVDPSFSMSSMTDVVFLLLIFFMLTSNFITPSGITVNLPQAKDSSITLQEVTVSVSKDLKYAVNDQRISKNDLEVYLERVLEGKEGKVVLHIDKSVPTEHFVHVAGIAKSLGADVSIAVDQKK